MGRSKRRALRRRQRSAHRLLNSGGHRYDSVEAFAPIAAFTRAGFEFQIALPAEIVLGGHAVGDETRLSLLLDNTQGQPVEVAKFWLERGDNQVVLEWTVAVTDTNWDTGADQRPIQEVTTAFCVAIFAGRPLDPALGIRFHAGLAITTQDRNGNLFAFNPGGRHG